jgi:putative transposase
MGRDARLVPDNGYLHVMCRGNNRRNIFIKRCDYRYYLVLAGKFKKEAAVRILHYCLMPNHVHFLLEVMPKTNLANFMKRLNLNYFFHYRKKREYVGHLWQGRFKSKILEKEAYFIQCGKYIELNPVRAGLCELPGEYPFSSYAYYADRKEDVLLDEDPFYSSFGQTPQERQRAYRDMIISEVVNGKMSFSNSMECNQLDGEGASPKSAIFGVEIEHKILLDSNE